MIYLAIILSPLSFIHETQVGSFGDCVNGSEGWEIGALLGRFLVLWWGLGWVIWPCFWLNCLSARCGICYLQGCRRVSDGSLGCVDLVCMLGVVIWLIIWRRISVVVGLVFRASVVMLVRRLV
jgi:hypothetical protein